MAFWLMFRHVPTGSGTQAWDQTRAARFQAWALSQCVQPAMLPSGKQLSGTFLMTNVTLRVTGLPLDGVDAAALGGGVARHQAERQGQRVTWAERAIRVGAGFKDPAA